MKTLENLHFNLWSVIFNYLWFTEAISVKSATKFLLNVFNKYLQVAKFYKMPSTQCIYFFERNSRKVFTYDITTQAHIKHLTCFKIPFNYGLVQIGDRVFLNGGSFTFEESLKAHYSIAKSSSSPDLDIQSKNKMKIACHLHCLIHLNENIFYSFGGMNNSKVISKGQKFNITQNKWVNAPSLIQSKFSPFGCSFNRQFVYIYGGYNPKTKYSTQIER